MPELLIIIKDFAANNPDFVTWSVAGLLFLSGLLLQKNWIKECISEWKLNYLLKNIGVESLHYITIPDGMDGKIFIENLILMPNKILLLGVKKYRGLIFAADKIDQWTQVIGNKSYKFDNPLHQLENDALTLNSKIEYSKVEGKVLFINGSEFPKGKPDNVIEISEIKGWQKGAASDISEALRTDWNKLSALVMRNDFVKDNGVYIDDENTSGLNVFSMLTMIVIISLWLSGRLL